MCCINIILLFSYCIHYMIAPTNPCIIFLNNFGLLCKTCNLNIWLWDKFAFNFWFLFFGCGNWIIFIIRTFHHIFSLVLFCYYDILDILDQVFLMNNFLFFLICTIVSSCDYYSVWLFLLLVLDHWLLCCVNFNINWLLLNFIIINCYYLLNIFIDMDLNWL
jgi:hypothetical protein